MDVLLNIQDFQKEERRLSPKISIISKPSVFIFVKLVSITLSIMRLHTKIFTFNKRLEKMAIASDFIAKDSKSRVGVSDEFYDEYSEVLNRFQGLYNKFEKVNFNKNKNFEILFSSILDNLYIAERNYRRECFKNNPPLDDNEAIEFISRITKKTLAEYDG